MHYANDGVNGEPIPLKPVNARQALPLDGCLWQSRARYTCVVVYQPMQQPPEPAPEPRKGRALRAKGIFK